MSGGRSWSSFAPTSLLQTPLLAGLLLGALAACDDSEGDNDGGGNPPGPPGTAAPQLAGPSRLVDDGDGVLDAGDRLIVRFDAPVRVNGATPDDFVLPAPGDTWGTGAGVAAGPADDEVTITLGAEPRLVLQGVFAAPPAPPGGRAPSGIDVAADLDGRITGTNGVDAAPSAAVDLVPTFGRRDELATGSAVALASDDLDLDGDLDLVVASAGGAAIWQNDGSGAFRPTGQPLAGTAIADVAIGDVNQDGIPDIVTAGAEIVLWLNAGGANVVRGASFGADATAIALGDLDGDGDLDLAQGNTNGRGDQIWINDGAGAFRDTTQRLADDDTVSLVLGDVDRDGDLDLLTVGGATNRLWLNEGNTMFTASGEDLGGGGTAAALRDLDGDGDPDAVTAGQEVTWLWANDGAGAFASTGELGDAVSRAVAVGDVDGDGRPDIVIGNAAGRGDEVVLIRAGIDPVDSGQRLDDEATTDALLADFDRDGDLDLALAHDGDGVAIWSNALSLTSSAGELTQASEFGDGRTFALTAADFDRDGDVDVVEGNDLRALRENIVWYNDGTGAFPAPSNGLATADTRAVVDGDLDGDGSPDIVVGGIDGMTRVWLNVGGNGTFPAPAQNLPPAATRALALGDLDGDGHLDLVRGGGRGQPTVVWANDGTGFLVPTQQSFGAGETTALALGDLDRDGDLDVLIGDESAGLRVLRNDGTGALADAGQIVGGWIGAIALGDLDRDGDPDAVIGRRVGTDLVLFNEGGQLLDSGQDLGLFDTAALALADFDLDGDLDVVTGHVDGSDVLWLNEGLGRLVESPQVLSTGETRALIAADLDGDGAPDLVTADGSVAGPVSVRLNR